MEREQIKLERMEDKRKKEEQESGGTNIEEIEVKRHEVEGLADQLGTMQVEQKEVFLVIFQVKQNSLYMRGGKQQLRKPGSLYLYGLRHPGCRGWMNRWW